MPKEKSEWLKNFIAGISNNTINLWDPSVFSELKDNEVKSVVKVLKKNSSLGTIKALETLNFSKAKLEPKNIASLLETVNSCQLKKLDVSNQVLSLVTADAIASQLKKNILQELILLSCELGGRELFTILEALSQNKSLNKLHITHHNLNSEMIEFIAEMLRINTKIEMLALQHCQLNSNKISPIIKALSNSKSLRELELSGNNFIYAAAKNLNSILSKHEPPIACISISWAIKNFEKTLADLAAEGFVELSLNDLQLTAQDVETISSQISSNKELSKVNIKETSLINVTIIVRALPVSTEITIDLSNQEVDIKLICELLRANTVSLDLSNTKLGPNDAKKIAESLKENKSLKLLDLSSNPLGDEGIEYLSQTLSESNSALTHLNLNINNLTTLALERIVAMLTFNYKLLNVSCRGKIYSTKTKPLKAGPIYIEPIFTISLIGLGGVGKSCIAMQFISGRYVDEYDPTLEDSYRKAFSNCILDLYDLSGIEEFSSVRTSYYPRTDLFLVCFSLTYRVSFSEIMHLRDEIDRYRPGAPFLLIGTKSDLSDEFEVNDKEAQELAQELGDEEYIKCSARTGFNIDYIFQRASEICFKTKQDISNRQLWQRMQLLIQRNRELNETSIELKKLKDENKKLEALLNATKSSQALISPSSKQPTELAASLKANATQSYNQLPKTVQPPLRYRYNQEGKLISGSPTSTTKPPLRWQRNAEGKLITTGVSFWQSQAIASAKETTPALAAKTKSTATIVEKENTSLSQPKP